MRWISAILILLAASSGEAAGPAFEFTRGREFYGSGDFKEALRHFQLALKDAPDDAAACYWIGMSYQHLADIATPFGGRDDAKARKYLTRAVELAPDRRDYRLALFDFLVDPDESSRSSRRQAAAILLAVPESDPDYSAMRQHLDAATGSRLSADAVIANVFLAVPRASYRAAEISLDARRRISSLLAADQ